MTDNGTERRDTTVFAPAARSGASARLPGAGIYVPGQEALAAYVAPEPEIRLASDAEIVAEQARTIHRLEEEKRTLQYACSTISTAAVAMALVLIEMGAGAADTILIRRAVIDKATGSRIALDEQGDDVRVRISTQVDRDFAVGE